MRSTICLRVGFIARSISELGRKSKLAPNWDHLDGTQADLSLLSLHTPKDLDKIAVFSDADFGGFSKAAFSINASKQGFATFHGRISTALPNNNEEVQRSGYAAFRSRGTKRNLWGQVVWDIDPFDYIAVRIKSDGRKYFVNLQTQSLVYEDLHQHRLFAKTPGDWETVHIPINDFVRTNHGEVVEPQMEMRKEKVRTVGIGLIDRIDGDFCLSIQDIWATNTTSELPTFLSPKYS